MVTNHEARLTLHRAVFGIVFYAPSVALSLKLLLSVFLTSRFVCLTYDMTLRSGMAPESTGRSSTPTSIRAIRRCAQCPVTGRNFLEHPVE